MCPSAIQKKCKEHTEIAKMAMVFAWVRDGAFSDTFFQLTDQAATSLDLQQMLTHLLFTSTVPLLPTSCN